MREKMKRQNYMIPENLIESLQKKAIETGLTPSDIVRLAIKEYTKNKNKI